MNGHSLEQLRRWPILFSLYTKHLSLEFDILSTFPNQRRFYIILFSLHLPIIQQYYQKMENDSCEQTQPCLPNNSESFPAPSLPSQQIFQCPRFTIASNKPKNSRVKRNKTVELQGKSEDVTHKLDEKLRLAAKGVRQPILGELPCKKILEEYREGSTRNKKKSFFLCC